MGVMTALSFAFFGMMLWEESRIFGGLLLGLAVFRSWALMGSVRQLLRRD